MRRLRHDANHLVSALLLGATAVAVLTGVVAHLWDLNDFAYHTWAGYVMTALAVAHVLLSWGQLTAYARFRMRRSGQPSAVRSQRRPVLPVHPGRAAAAALVSRRGLLGLGIGGLAGVLGGRGLRQPPVIPQGADVGVVYHEWSKPGVLDALGSVANWGEQPPLYKRYPDAPRIALPRPEVLAGLATEEAITSRRSTRDYSGSPMSARELSQVLFLTAGLTADRWGHGLRSSPSSGALYPIEVYPVVHGVEGVEPGVYHYGVEDHALAQVRAGNFRGELVRQGLMQEFLGQANVVLLLTVIFQRMRFKYQDRTYRYGLIEAGHLGQNAYLAATSMGLGACAVGAFLDDAINDMLGVDGREEAAVYMLAVGNAA